MPIDIHPNDFFGARGVMAWYPGPIGSGAAIRLNGPWPQKQRHSWWPWWDDGEEATPNVEYTDGIAIVRINGAIRPESVWWSRTPGLVELEDTVGELAYSDKSDRTVLHITSPGGLMDRLEDFSGVIREHSRVKPIDCFCSDLMGSAAMWIGAQCDSVYCDPLALVGGLGVFTILTDTSKLWEEIGVFSILVRDNDDGVKGLGALEEVTEEYVKDAKRIVLSGSEMFRAAMMRGRGWNEAKTNAMFDGRVWLGTEALGNGLVDGVTTRRQYLKSVAAGELPPTMEAAMPKPRQMDDEMDDEMDDPEEREAFDFFRKIFSGGRRAIRRAGVNREQRKAQALAAPRRRKTEAGDGNGASARITSYQQRTARMEIRTHVREQMKGLKLTPGMQAVEGLEDLLCLNLTLSAYADARADDGGSDEFFEGLFAACPTAYELASDCVDETEALRSAMGLFPVEDPFGVIMDAFGSAPRFVANDPTLKNFAGRKRAGRAPRGDGDGEQSKGSSADQRQPAFSALGAAQKRVLARLTGGKVKDESTYDAATTGIPFAAAGTASEPEEMNDE
jgi:ClpP class serine protease